MLFFVPAGGGFMKFTTVLMDADNTIFDFPLCEYNALKNTLINSGLEFNDYIYNSFSVINDRLWKKLEQNKTTRSELKIQRFRELTEKCFHGFGNATELAKEYVLQLSMQGILIDGAYDALEELSGLFDIYIITNGLKLVQRGRFARTSITRFIRKIYISEEIGYQKPMKVFFDYVLSDIPEKDKDKILVVGDSLTSDMQGGRNSGLTTCLYDPENLIEMPNNLCDYKIDTLLKIKDISLGDMI